MSEVEEPLAGGDLNSAVVRIGDTIRRASGPWTPDVLALLEHLAGIGYPAPQPKGTDEQGREVLSFVPGAAIHPDHLHLIASLDGLRRAARLIADYHDAQQTFRPPSDARWRDNGRDPTGSDEVLAHNDFAPWNLIAGPDWVYIDWDLVAPGRATGILRGPFTHSLVSGPKPAIPIPSSFNASPRSATRPAFLFPSVLHCSTRSSSEPRTTPPNCHCCPGAKGRSSVAGSGCGKSGRQEVEHELAVADLVFDDEREVAALPADQLAAHYGMRFGTHLASTDRRFGRGL